ERHPAGDVIEDAIADSHRFDAPAVPALEALDREAEDAGLAEGLGRPGDHPVLRRPPLGAAPFALSLRATGPGGCLYGCLWNFGFVAHHRIVAGRTIRGGGGWGP